jgi:hypothetical protein
VIAYSNSQDEVLFQKKKKTPGKLSAHTWTMQSTISLLMDWLLLFRIRTTKGLRMSFWKVKLASSARSKYFIPSCLRESMAYMAIFSSWWLPAEIKWFAKTDQILAQTWNKYQRKTLKPVKKSKCNWWCKQEIIVEQHAFMNNHQ